MSPTNGLETAYKKRLFENNKNFIPQDDYSWYYLKKVLPDSKNISILDAGCGSGKYCKKLISLGYSNIFGIDLFDEDQFKSTTINYTRSSIDSTSFEDNFFDVIFANSVIYHLENPEKGILELSRILKKNGILILTGHTKHSLFTYWRKIKLFLNIKSVQNLRHVYFRRTKEYIDLLKQNGFEIIIQDGYHLSFIFYPYYRKKALGLIEKKGWKMPLIRPRMSKFKFWAKIKSEHAYHFVIISRKTA
jgi:2-polyprenyl-3-methyl-5-hydroxy-6-metoxy-1,4-benzoquinol methylase